MLMTDVPTYKKNLLIVLPSMVKAEKFSDHPRITVLAGCVQRYWFKFDHCMSSLHYLIHTGSGAHLTFYPLGVRGPLCSWL